jgi:lipoprotein
MHGFRLAWRADDVNLAVNLVPALVWGCFEEELILSRVEKVKVNGVLIGGDNVFWMGC